MKRTKNNLLIILILLLGCMPLVHAAAQDGDVMSFEMPFGISFDMSSNGGDMFSEGIDLGSMNIGNSLGHDPFSGFDAVGVTDLNIGSVSLDEGLFHLRLRSEKIHQPNIVVSNIPLTEEVHTYGRSRRAQSASSSGLRTTLTSTFLRSTGFGGGHSTSPLTSGGFDGLDEDEEEIIDPGTGNLDVPGEPIGDCPWLLMILLVGIYGWIGYKKRIRG